MYNEDHVSSLFSRVLFVVYRYIWDYIANGYKYLRGCMCSY